MKKLFFVLTVLLIIAGGSIVNATTVNVNVKNIDVDGIYGLGFDIIPSPFDKNDFTLLALLAMPSVWDYGFTSNGVACLDWDAEVSLGEGYFLEIEGNSAFELTNFILGANNGDPLDGFTVDLVDNTYKISSIPIPGAIWLFISGLIGLVGIKRRLS